MSISSELSAESLMKSLGSADRVKFLFNSISAGKIKASKKVYNLQSRNVKQFMKDQIEMDRKQQIKQKQIKKMGSPSSGKRYDENQLMEMDHIVTRKRSHQQRIQTEPPQLTFLSKGKVVNTSSLNSQSKKTVQGGEKQNKQIKKRISLFEKNIALETPQNQQRKPSIIDRAGGLKGLPEIFPRNKSNSIVDINSPLRRRNRSSLNRHIHDSSGASKSKDKKKELNIAARKSILLKKAQQKLIEITDDKMLRYINNLHELLNGIYIQGKALDQREASRVIRQRYTLQEEMFKERKTTDLKAFHFPFMQFVSENEIRKSIHRIVNMSVKNAQKVTFNLIDINQNGAIDEKDMLCMIQLIDKIPEIKHDFCKITDFLFREKSVSETFSLGFQAGNSQRENTSGQRKIRKKNQQVSDRLTPKNLRKQSSKFTFSREKQVSAEDSDSLINEQSDTQSQKKPKKEVSKKKEKPINLKFDKRRHFSFLQTKQIFKKPVVEQQKCQMLITLQQFHKIFGDERPAIFYDILKFLFKVKKEDFIWPPRFFQNQIKYSEPKSTKLYELSQVTFKDYNVQKIVTDMKRKFEKDLPVSKYNDNRKKLTKSLEAR